MHLTPIFPPGLDSASVAATCGCMGLKINWRRPLTWILMPAVILLVMVGILPPFPPARPTRPSQEQSEPARKDGDA